MSIIEILQIALGVYIGMSLIGISNSLFSIGSTITAADIYKTAIMGVLISPVITFQLINIDVFFEFAKTLDPITFNSFDGWFLLLVPLLAVPMIYITTTIKNAGQSRHG